MLQKKEWFTRSFVTIEEEGILPSILERLAGTPLRLEHKVQGMTDNDLEKKPGGKWSIKEEIGHLSDLEILWYTRVGNLQNGEDLIPADLENKKTHLANHNATPLADLLKQFRDQREKLVDRIAQLSAEDQQKTSLHPRLQKPMRIVDLAFFAAEHDDHHLAQVSILIKLLSA